MRRGAGIGVGEASDPGDIAGQFDDPLVVDVVQHKIEVSAPGAIALGDRCSQPYIWVETAEIQSGCFPWRPQSQFGRRGVIQCGTQASGGKPPRLPGDTPASRKAGRTELTWTR